MHDQAIDLMQQLGFGAYEAKAYIGIIEHQPVGAYELAKRSGVPSSKIYETINKLLNKEVAQFSNSDGADNPTYVALPPEDLARRINQQTSHKTKRLLPLLSNLQKATTPDFIWPIATQAALEEQAQAMIQSAQKSILVSCWPEKLSWLTPVLREAEQKDLNIALVHFGASDLVIGATYHHPVEKTLYEEKGGRGLTLVTDSAQVILANMSANGDFNACWSKNPAFVTVAEDYVKHDVYITKVTKHLNAEMTQRYGSEFEQLRNIYSPEA